MKRLLALLVIVLLTSATPVKAEWAGWQWASPPIPPTVVDLYDDSPAPLSDTVRNMAQMWSDATPYFKLIYHHGPCKSLNGVLSVCAAYLEGAASSWATPTYNRQNGNLRKVSVFLNTWFDVFHEPKLSDPTYESTRALLVAHEMGGAIGLQERCWPYDPADPVTNALHYGAMNLCYNGAFASPDDIATLTQLYGQ